MRTTDGIAGITPRRVQSHQQRGEEMQTDELLAEIGEGIADAPDIDVGLSWALGRILKEFGCVVGTIHSLPTGSNVLVLRAQAGVPPPLVEKVREVPIGKGMGG